MARARRRRRVAWLSAAEHDEFIRADHSRYLAERLPHGELVRLEGVSHFAPVQRPELFDRTVTTFLAASRDTRP
jgi:pimeloyl-ACP methyl ester carboxylesterase